VGRIGCVAIVKNEERHIAEWLAWQFLLGFDTVFLLNNCSTDATAAIARRFAPVHDVRVIDYPNQTPDYQVRGYERLARQVAREYEWLAFFDADEYLRLDEGLTLKALLAQRPEAAIAIPWAIFGSNGHQDFPDGLVVESFTRRSTPEFGPNLHVKSIIRPALMEVALNPHAFKVRGGYVDLLGRPVRWGQTEGCLAEVPDYAGGALNHYFVRSSAHWREKLARGYHDLTRKTEEFTVYDRNEVEDGRATRYVPAIRALLSTMEREEAPRLGIAITTFNRREMVLELVAALRRLTTMPFELVICDDGSEDGTVQALRERGEMVITGPNRGIARNKNRGLYHLMVTRPVETVLLLDDDVMPLAKGWEGEWIEAARRFGHVNFAHSGSHSQHVSGNMTAETPSLTPALNGCVLAFDRRVLAMLGFMDPRFGGYGHEHTEFTLRAIRVGYGGVVLKESEGDRTLFYVIKGGLDALPVTGAGTEDAIQANGLVMAAIMHEQIYRHAWRDDVEMSEFLAEQEETRNYRDRLLPRQMNIFPSLATYEQARKSWEQGEGADTDPASIYLIAAADPALIEAALAGDGKVIAVQPDVRLYYALAERFAAPIAQGRLVLENFAPAPRGGEIAMLHPGDGGRPYPVATISWDELVARHGRPASVRMGAQVPGFPAMAQ